MFYDLEIVLTLSLKAMTFKGSENTFTSRLFGNIVLFSF